MRATRRDIIGGALWGLAASGLPFIRPAAAQSEAPLRIAISLSDIPRMWAAPDGGYEGARFGGLLVYDSLVQWDLSVADKPTHIIGALAESWHIDPADKRRWLFTLRRGVRFHDGSPFNADAVIWNLDAIFNSKAPQYNAQRSGQMRFHMPSLASYEKVDDGTIAMVTREPNGLFGYELSLMLMASPARYAEVGSDWSKFSTQPSGTGPYRFVALVPRERLELQANAEYWNAKRVPKTKKLILSPIPDPNTRVAALRAGQVDMIESLPPDAIESLKGAGFQVVMNIYPHVWVWRLNFVAPSPFADIRVRKAANLAIDREAIVKLNNGTAVAAKGLVVPGSPWFGKPSFDVRYDPDEAKRLLAEAGYSLAKPAKLKIIIASNGGGQMQPLPMNEAIQENLKAVGIEVDYQVVDFATIINMFRTGSKSENQKGADAINVATPMQEPDTGFAWFNSTHVSPRGTNWGYFNNPEVDAALSAARAELDPAKSDAALAHVHELLVDQAAALFVVHDMSPRALSPRVQGFVQAQNWFQDYTPITLRS